MLITTLPKASLRTLLHVRRDALGNIIPNMWPAMRTLRIGNPTSMAVQAACNAADYGNTPLLTTR